MCDFAAPAVLDRYPAASRTRVERFQDSWPLCVLANARCRSEHWEAEHRRQSLFHDSSPELSAHVPERHWNSVIRESSNDRDIGKEKMEDKVKVKASGRNANKEERCRSRSPKGATQKQRGRVGGDHLLRGRDLKDIAPRPAS